MKSMRFILPITLAALGLAGTLGSPLYAAGNSYGGGYGGYGYGYGASPTRKQVTIDKKVRNPQTNAFMDNLTLNDPKYKPDQEITFQITLTNTGSETLSNIQVNDTVPQYLSLNSGNLAYDINTKTYSYAIESLKPGETNTMNLKGKIASSNQLPVDNGVFCLVNQASVVVSDVKTQDNSQFCVEKQITNTTKGGLPVYNAPNLVKTPATGPEALVLFALAPLGALGSLLRRKAA